MREDRRFTEQSRVAVQEGRGPGAVDNKGTGRPGEGATDHIPMPADSEGRPGDW